MIELYILQKSNNVELDRLILENFDLSAFKFDLFLLLSIPLIFFKRKKKLN